MSQNELQSLTISHHAQKSFNEGKKLLRPKESLRLFSDSFPCVRTSQSQSNYVTCFACAVAIYRMGNRSGAKIRGKWERKWKMAPGLKWPKNGHRNGKNREKWPKSHFWSHFSISVAMFRPFQAGGHFPFSFPFSPDFCAGPVSHSVDAHRTRNTCCIQVRSDNADSVQLVRDFAQGLMK